MKFINSLFGDTEPGQRPRVLTLSTIHKAKGREWSSVFILGANKYMPSKWARKEWQMEQETNLEYVADTRSKSVLISINV
jgi:superfamily I DNA/RNA helicase